MACYDFDRMERHMYGMTAIPPNGSDFSVAVSTRASVSHHP